MFSVVLITTVELADRLIRNAQKEKRILQNRIEVYNIRNENTVESTGEYDAELAEANASLSSTNTLLGTLPEGDLKEEQITKKMELELKIRKLTTSGRKIGSEAILKRELDIDQISMQVEGLDSFIAAVTTRRG